MAQRSYSHLTEHDRGMISKSRASRLSLSEIARQLGKDESTISR